MTRLLLHLTMLLLALLASVLTVVRAQPFDDDGLRAGLLTPGCVLPCFMGIRPGVTTRDDALHLLQTHPWVSSVDTLLNDRGLTWEWSGAQPAFLSGGYTQNSILLRDGVVTRIDFLTRENLATFLIVFGMPDVWSSKTWLMLDMHQNVIGTHFAQSAAYHAYPMEVATESACPIGFPDQWALQTQISLPAQPTEVGYRAYSHTPLLRISAIGSCP